MKKRKKTTKQILLEREKKKWENFNKPITYNPIPVRKEKDTTKVFISIEQKSNFINVNGGYFNIGKKKGCMVESADLKYINWVIENIQLNDSELRLLRRVASKKKLKLNNKS